MSLSQLTTGITAGILTIGAFALLLLALVALLDALAHKLMARLEAYAPMLLGLYVVASLFAAVLVARLVALQ